MTSDYHGKSEINLQLTYFAQLRNMLKVKVKGATNLPDVDTFSGKSDPYATVSFQGKF